MSRMMLRRDMTLLRGLLFGGRQQLCNFSNTTTRAASSSSSSQAAPDKAPEDSSSSSSDWFNQVTAGDIDERVVPKPVSVMPDHLPQVRRRQHQKPWWKFRHFVDIHTKPTDPAASEYTETPQYPPIYDTSPEGIRKQVRKEWYAAIRRLPSAEQKIYEITKHYGHLSYMIEPVGRLFNGLAIQQAITRTVLLHELPPSYSTTDLELDGRLKDALLTAIANRLFQSRSRPAFVHFKRSALSRFGFADGENYVQSAKEEDILADVASIVRGFSSSSAQSTETALLQVDYNAAVAASWWVNDFPVPFPKKHWFRDEKTRDQLFTYKSTHALHLRSETPLVQVRAVVEQNFYYTLCLPFSKHFFFPLSFSVGPFHRSAPFLAAPSGALCHQYLPSGLSPPPPQHHVPARLLAQPLRRLRLPLPDWPLAGATARPPGPGRRGPRLWRL